MTYDIPSTQRLALVAPALQRKVIAAMNALAAEGIFFRVAQGLRDDAEQNADFAKGRYPDGAVIPRGQPGHGTVTNARAGYSNHNFGCAVDCFPFIHGENGPIDLEDSTLPIFQAMIAALKAQGLAWGGDWLKIHDAPHFQLANVPATPTDADRALLHSGGLHAVWQHHDAL